jgi:pimeloyl-ACP methyl ester carboxylesterase
MAIVLLHGNPETPVIWEPLVAELGALGHGDVITPWLPGFGCATPAGFDATKEAYVDWFTGELETIVAEQGPVDLVAHDWGGGIGMRVVSQRPDLVRTWVTDVLGLFHPDYVWHDAAQVWQTPGAGEESFAQMLATPDEVVVTLFESIGIPASVGARIVAAIDEEMARCVLALYRSAAQPAMLPWGEQIGRAAERPGLSLFAPNDPYVRGHDLAHVVAERLGAETVELTGQGHFWMLGDPATAARTLHTFWLGATSTHDDGKARPTGL